jgi:hypothetical protein
MSRSGLAPGIPIDPTVQRLLDLLRDPPAAVGATEREWDGVVRVARATRAQRPRGPDAVATNDEVLGRGKEIGDELQRPERFVRIPALTTPRSRATP